MSSGPVCGACGRQAGPADAFCGGCGVQLRDPGQGATMVYASDSGSQGDRCGSCNSPVGGEVSFCTACGAPRPATDTGLRLAPVRDLQDRLQAAAKGEYQVLSHLGRGGMGSVFLALDRSLHRHVAIKVMAPGLLQDANMLERFRTEARIVATLRHPGIVNIHGFRSVEDLHFFIMDFVEGATLRQIVRSRGPLPIDVVRTVLYDVGSALHHAHLRAGVIHRDVKPSNIILDSSGHAVVMDFGISKAANTRVGLTMTGVVVGTPEYMSPEQCRGGEVTPASDQYSLGLVAYTMLTGSPPFTGQHWSVLSQQTTAAPPPLLSLRPDCPADVAEAIERMLAKAPRDRFPDTLAAVKALGGQRYEEGDPIRDALTELVGRESAAAARAAPVAGIALEGVPDRAEPGDVLPITVVALDALGRALLDRAVVVESTDPSIVEVTASGTLRAVKEGTIRVVARSEGVEITRPLVVSPIPVAAVEIAPVAPPVRQGARRRLEAAVKDEQGRSLTGRSVVWASSDPDVVEVSRTGEIRVHAPGKATVVATCEGRSSTLELDVPEGGPIEEATVATSETRAGAEGAREKGGTAPARPPASRPAPRPRPAKKKESKATAWAAALVLVLGGAGGGYWAYGEYLANPVDTSTTTLTTGPASAPSPPVGLALLSGGAAVGASLPLYVGDSLRLEGALRDSAGASVPGRMAWSSSDPAIATVSDDGTVTGVGVGTTTVTVASAGLSQRLELVVAAPTLRVAVTTGTGGSVAGGIDLDMDATLELRANVLGEDGAPVPGRTFAWRSSSPAVASVTTDGRVRGMAPGRASVTVSAGDVTQTVEVRVRAVVAEVSVVRADTGVPAEDRVQVQRGSTLRLSAVAYAPGRRRIDGLAANWSSADASVASIDASGTVTGNRDGATLVLVRVGDAVSDVTVEVVAPPPGTLVLTVRPYAYVTIDGTRRDGEQRRLELSLPAGTHDLRLEHPTLGVFDTTFVVQSSRATTIDKLMSPGGQ